MMELSAKGLDLIKSFEGFRSEAYQCSAGKWTIGYGSTYYKSFRPVDKYQKITEPEALELLKYTCDTYYSKAVNESVVVPLTQNQFDALVSLVYNIGPANFKGSTLLRLLNNKDYIGASNQFGKWKFVGKAISKGLENRRKKEQELFDEQG